MSEYIVELPMSGAADEFIAKHGVDDCRLYGYKLTGEIVRCRDCRHYHIVRMWTGADGAECWLRADYGSGALGKEPTEPNGYCAWGERKEGSE